MKTELKPCPFCGGKVVIDQSDEFWFSFDCSNKKCLLYGIPFVLPVEEKEWAIKKWNIRKGHNCEKEECWAHPWNEKKLVKK